MAYRGILYLPVVADEADRVRDALLSVLSALSQVDDRKGVYWKIRAIWTSCCVLILSRYVVVAHSRGITLQKTTPSTRGTPFT